ncbi:MAG: putative selenate ABC transporter substrate-binding protein [Akkermansiaceae bacterium]|jgi:phosphonate transport system substrate-binding protein
MNSFKPGDRSIAQMLKGCASGMLIAGAAIALTSCGEKKADADASTAVLRFSAIPDADTTAQAERYQPVADYLGKKLGIKVEFVSSDSYPASVQKFANGDIHLAWFGGVSGVQARQAVEGARAVASGEADLTFKSYFIANASTGLTRSEDFPGAIANLSFTYGSASSTSGCIMPSHFIMENTGKGPMDFFQKKPIGFSGAHDKTALAVQDGTFQTGALNFSTFDKMLEAGELDPAKVNVIWETPPYADYNFTAHPALEEAFGEGFIDKLRDALVSCDDAATLKALGRKKLVKVDNDTFAGIASVMEKVKFD